MDLGEGGLTYMDPQDPIFIKTQHLQCILFWGLQFSNHSVCDLDCKAAFVQALRAAFLALITSWTSDDCRSAFV